MFEEKIKLKYFTFSKLQIHSLETFLYSQSRLISQSSHSPSSWSWPLRVWWKFASRLTIAWQHYNFLCTLLSNWQIFSSQTRYEDLIGMFARERDWHTHGIKCQSRINIEKTFAVFKIHNSQRRSTNICFYCDFYKSRAKKSFFAWVKAINIDWRITCERGESCKALIKPTEKRNLLYELQVTLHWPLERNILSIKVSAMCIHFSWPAINHSGSW